MAKAVEAQSGSYAALELVAKEFRSTPQVEALLRAELGIDDAKAAVAAGTTSDATFAAPLVAYGVFSEVLQVMRGAGAFDQLASRFRRVPFRTRVPRETGSGAGGAWVGEGLATPVAALAYDTLTVEAYKAAKIVVLSRELQMVGNPDAERVVRDSVVAGVAAFLDQQLLDPAVTLSANLRPASLTNGATAVTQSGTTAAAMTTDLVSLLAAITTNGAGLVWVFPPLTGARVAATLGAAAGDMPRTLFGIPVIFSANSPQQITLIDTSHILFAEDEGKFDISISEQAAIEMNDSPANPTVAATVMTSLFQRDLFGVRITRFVSYLRAQTGAVSYMVTTY